jgi:hypothetical protein
MASSLFTRSFWEATLQRVLRVFAAALFATVSADGFNILHTDWKQNLATAALAPILTLLFCVAGDAYTNGAGPAFGGIETTNFKAARLRGEGGYGVLGLIGVVLLVIALILFLGILLKAFLVSWFVVVITAVVGLVLVLLDGGAVRRRF